MDLEHLTKHQILLLTLLVSFVTSIATGIVTVSLIDQAPLSVVRTINSVVERTVETVVPATANTAAATVTEKTIFVTNEELATQAIALVQKSIVRIVEKNSDLLLARGVIVGPNGLTITDRGALDSGKEIEVLLPEGQRVPATLRDPKAASGITVLEVAVGTSSGFAPAKLANASALQLGQSVIRIGGVGSDVVGLGVVARLFQQGNNHPNLIEASVSSATPGSVLLNLSGEVVGITTGESRAVSADAYSILNPSLLTGPEPSS